MKEKLLILILFLLLGGVFAESPDSLSFNLFPMALAVLISLSFAVIVFLISQLAQSPQLDAWAKTEMTEIFTTVLIAVILVGLIVSANILPTLTGLGENYEDLILNNIIKQRTNTIRTFDHLSHTNFILTRYSSFSYSKTSSIPVVDWLYTQFESRSQNFGLGPLVSKFNRSFDSLGQAIFILTAEKIILQYLLYAIPLFFFPLAIVLRALTFTKKFGNILLAFCIAGYFIFPLSVVFAGEIYNTLLPNEVLNSQLSTIFDTTKRIDPGNIPAQGIICSTIPASIAQLGQFGFIVSVCATLCAIIGWFTGGFYTCYVACKPIAEIIYYFAVPMFQYTYGAALSGFAVMEGATFDQTYDLIIKTILPLVTLQWLLAIVLPLISIILTIVSVKSISSALGADIHIYGLSRLI
ncbi:hypothetical protein KO317_00500 [Candidatus Micrarchaeota archaeon]|nr:hypothetical protein [Candidatus Micrarchaeota archaeon]